MRYQIPYISPPRCRRILASLLAALMLAHNGVLCYAIETNLTPQRSNLPPALAPQFSYGYGTLRDFPQRHSKNEMTVVHIQDIHMNEEAQRNIAAVLSKLKKDQVGLVGVEGAFSPLEMERFSTYPHPESVLAVANAMLTQGDISGAVFSGLTHPQLPPLVGVDQADLYFKNVNGYRNASRYIKTNLTQLAAFENELSHQKNRTYNSQLSLFDREMERYQLQNGGVVDYSRKLKTYALATEWERAGNLQRLLLISNMEPVLDFKKVSDERSLVIQSLLSK